MNLVVLKGNLGKEPVTKDVQGQMVCEFSLATKGYKDQTDWHNIKAWGKTAEICSKYLEKGSSALIQGRIQYRQWKDKEGNTKYATEIIAEKVELLGGKKSDAEKTSDELEVPF